MITYTGRRSLIGTLANNTTSTFLDAMDTLMNEAELRLCSMRAWPFLEEQYTFTTVASQQEYAINGQMDEVESVYITIDSTRHRLQEVNSRKEWDKLNELTAVTSEIATHFFIYDGKVGIYPTPATAGYTGTINGKKKAKALSLADYADGTITTATNGSTALVGSGTAWTAKMAGMWIRITDSSTANTGDGHWYEIASVGSATTLTLARPYGGTSIAAGSATYTIGQVSALHEPYHLIPIYEALEIYFTSMKPESDRAQLYANKAKELMAQLVGDAGSKSESVVIRKSI